MDIYTITTFFLIISLMVMSPGPNAALLLKTVPVLGKKHGYANVIGVVAAFYLHGTFSALGLSAILVSSASLYFIVKVVGALYLAYLGIKAIISALNHSKSIKIFPVYKPKVPTVKLTKSFGEGLLTNLLNPKVSIFYLAAFPQFINFESNVIASSYLLVTIHALFAAVWFSTLVFLIGSTKLLLNSTRLQVWLQSVTGAVLLWFSYRIATVK